MATTHKHARPKTERVPAESRSRAQTSVPRRKAEAGPRWIRTGRGRAVLLVAVVGVAVTTGVLLAGPGDRRDDGATPGLAAPGTGIDWIAEDGSAYRLTVTPTVRPVSEASQSGCITAPEPGTTNLSFVVEIENRTPTAAEVPELEFAVNVTESGAVDPAPIAFAEGSQRIEMTPAVGGRICADAASIGPIGRQRIATGATATFTGTIGGVVTPVGDGLALLVRYAEADSGSPTGSTTTVVRVPFLGS